MNSVETHLATIDQLRSLRTRLDATVEYQRRHVWKPKDNSFLLDSIIRGAPIGTLCLYSPNGESWAQYLKGQASAKLEVVDGKQRTRAIFGFLDGDTCDRDAVSKMIEEDGSRIDVPFSLENFYDREFGDIGQDHQARFLGYRFPVLFVTGTREFAVNAFVRMNRQGYGLSPQELRNAIYLDSEVRQLILSMAKILLDEMPNKGGVIGALSVCTPDQIKRMHDVQLLTELVMLRFNHASGRRRDGIDPFYKEFAKLDADRSSEVEAALSWVVDKIDKIFNATGKKPLHLKGFPRNAENDFYGLIGALDRLELSGHALEGATLANWVSKCGDLREVVVDVVKAKRASDQKADRALAKSNPLAHRYGSTLLGGQVNSETNRETRIGVFVQLGRSFA